MMLSCRKTTHNLWRIILNNSISTWPSCEPLCSDREATWKEGRVGLQLKWTSSVQLWRSNPNLEPDETSVEMIDFCSILFLFVQRCFCNGKNYTHSNSYRDSGGIKQNHFIPPPTACCKCPFLTSHRWARACLSFCHVKEKQRLSTRKNSDPPCQKAVDTWCCGDEMVSFVNCGCVSL